MQNIDKTDTLNKENAGDFASEIIPKDAWFQACRKNERYFDFFLKLLQGKYNKCYQCVSGVYNMRYEVTVTSVIKRGKKERYE